MSLRVKIPKEITTYQEKIVFGLSGRQLICSVIALTLSIGSGYLLSAVLKQDSGTVGWVIILIVMPVVIVGWLKPNGFYIEDYIKIRMRYNKQVGKRYSVKGGAVSGVENKGKKGSAKKTSKKRKIK